VRIALLHYAAPPVVGGVESVIGHHSVLMGNAGYEVSIIAGRGAQLDGNIPFISIPLVDSRHPEILAAKAFLDRGIIPGNFDNLVDTLIVDLEKCLVGVNVPRLIIWHHDLAWTTPRYQGEMHDGYPWDLLRIDWPKAIQVTISEPRRQELAVLLDTPVDRISVIPNGIDVNSFLKLEELTQKLVIKLDLLTATPLLFLPVRITPRKNIELALRTLAALHREYRDAVLVVAGPLGPHNPANAAYFNKLTGLRAELELNKAVHFLAEQVKGYIPDSVISDFYQLADALLFPSREEGFGIPILEAGLAGLPIFCADIPPLHELGGNCVTYFSPEIDPVALAEMIKQRLDDDMVFGLRRQVKYKYTWDKIFVEQIQPLLLRLGG
jgi:glycosyltransferase involved in cell wall biosynthesis